MERACRSTDLAGLPLAPQSDAEALERRDRSTPPASQIRAHDVDDRRRARSSLRLRQLPFLLYSPSPGNRIKCRTHTYRPTTIRGSHPHFFRNVVHRHIQRIGWNRFVPWSKPFVTETTLQAQQENRSTPSRSIMSFGPSSWETR